MDSTYVTTGSSSIVNFLPRYTMGMARTVGVLSGIALLLDLPEMSQRQLEYPPSVQAQVSSIENGTSPPVISRQKSALQR
jgi:hypothetical protein